MIGQAVCTHAEVGPACPVTHASLSSNMLDRRLMSRLREEYELMLTNADITAPGSLHTKTHSGESQPQFTLG